MDKNFVGAPKTTKSMKILGYIVVHKQMYCIRTSLRRFQPLNIKSNIRVLNFHYIMEYFSNLSSSCPLHEQLKHSG